LGQVHDKRHEHTGGEVTVGDAGGPDAEDQGGGDLRDGVDTGEVDGDGGLGVGAQASVTLGLGGELGEGERGAAVHLGGTQTVDVLLEGGVDGTDLLPGAGVQARGDPAEHEGD